MLFYIYYRELENAIQWLINFQKKKLFFVSFSIFPYFFFKLKQKLNNKTEHKCNNHPLQFSLDTLNWTTRLFPFIVIKWKRQQNTSKQLLEWSWIKIYRASVNWYRVFIHLRNSKIANYHCCRFTHRIVNCSKSLLNCSVLTKTKEKELLVSHCWRVLRIISINYSNYLLMYSNGLF